MSRKSSHVSFAMLAAASLSGARRCFDIEGTPAVADTAGEPTEKKPTTAKMREEFARLNTEAQSVLDKAEQETRELTADETAANDKRFGRMKVIQKQIDDRAKFAKMVLTDDVQSGELNGATIQRGQGLPGKQEFERGAAPVTDAEKVDRKKFGRALTRWINEDRMDREFATITTATNSGLLLPTRIAQPIAPSAGNTFREAMQFVGVSPIETGDTANITVPVLDATAGGVISQTASSDTENPPTTTDSILLSGTTVYESGSAWWSNTALLAPGFDALAATLPELVLSKEYGLEGAIAAAIIADSGITNITATASTSALTYTNLVTWRNSIPKRWDTQVVMVFSQAGFNALQTLVDSTGRPVLNADPQNTSVMRVNGTPAFRCDFLEAFGASKVVGVLISMRAFKLRDVTPQRLAKYVNIPSRPDQVGLNLFANHGFGWAKGGMALLKTPAS